MVQCRKSSWSLAQLERSMQHASVMGVGLRGTAVTVLPDEITMASRAGESYPR